MASEPVHVELGPRAYDIAIVAEGSPSFGSFARQRCQGSSAFFVADENVGTFAQRRVLELTQTGFSTFLQLLPSGEAQKSLAVASELYERLLDLPADRQTLIVAVGGGVIGDLAGFVAATFARGLPLLMVPTTLLAMVDSSVGGKVGVNLPRAKNMVGVFHQPIGVWIDLGVLETLPEREYRSGLAEVVKYGVVCDAEFFAFLESHVAQIMMRERNVLRNIVARCCRLKADIVEKDERDETGLRAILNYGHTFAHAFETASGYGAWLHGEAVAAGMICASKLAERIGMIKADATVRQANLLKAFSLPTSPPKLPIESLLAIMRNDKKASAGRMRFVLPRRLGDAVLVDDINEADLERVLGDAP